VGAEIEAMAEIEHGRWAEERRREGWSLGQQRDDDALVHPDLVDWEALPMERQDISRRLVAARPTMLAEVAIQMYRSTTVLAGSADSEPNRMHENAAL